MMLQRQHKRPLHAVLGFDDLDLIYAVPQLLRLRAILVGAIGVGVLSAVAAMEWPLLWRGVVMVDLFAASVLFSLAACRQWLINAPWPKRSYAKLAGNFTGLQLE
ncbi:MAG TPA: hypothetical protein VGX76_13510 [Pirellulales bacterium]|jgi:hypothetical protein|nr:hypothetical protein [Pirellulales bacterium]